MGRRGGLGATYWLQESSPRGDEGAIFPSDEAKNLFDEVPEIMDEQISLIDDVKSLVHDVFPVSVEIRNPTRKQIFLIDDVFGLMDEQILAIVEAATLIDEAENLTTEAFILKAAPERRFGAADASQQTSFRHPATR